MKFNRQEIFDIIVLHARKQQRHSKNSSGACLYRNNNDKCFIGILIPDEKYKLSFEGKNISYIPIQNAIFERQLRSNQEFFLEDLQKIHDINFVENWETLFKEFAERYNLNLIPLDRPKAL